MLRGLATKAPQVAFSVITWCCAAAATPVEGSPTPPAETDVSAPTVWYRSAEGCPSGEQFVARVAGYNQGVRLARAGDRIDFVVTVAAGSEGAVGRLERQTNAGTIAISEVKDPNCDAVATALALSLGLSLTPDGATSTSTDVPSGVAVAETRSSDGGEPGAAPSPKSSPVVDSKRANSGADLGPRRKPEVDSAVTASRDVVSETQSTSWHVAAITEGAFALNPSAVWGGGAFVERSARSAGYGTWSGRLGITGHFGNEATNVGRVEQWLVAARAGLVPIVWSVFGARISPFAELDLGAVTAEGTASNGKRAASFWGSVGVGARLGVALGRGMELQSQAAARAPLNPYRMRNEQETLFESRPVGLWVGLGLGVPLSLFVARE